MSSLIFSDPKTILRKVQKIEGLIETIHGLAKGTEVICGHVHFDIFINVFMQGMDTSKVSAVSQQLSSVAEFRIQECAGEDCMISDR